MNKYLFFLFLISSVLSFKTIKGQGNTCGGATTITVGTCLTGETINDNTINTPTNTCGPMPPRREGWYSFVANSASITVSFDATDRNPYIEVFSSCAGAGPSIGCINANTGTGGHKETLALTTLTVGNTYYIKIMNSTNNNMTGDLCVFGKPSNDECLAATTLSVNAADVCTLKSPGSILGATASSYSNACGGTADDDVWFKFVATSTLQAITLSNVNGSTTDLYHSVYGNACGALGIPIVCSDPNTSTLSGLVIGSTYFVRVYTTSGTGGQTTTFDICIRTPAPIGPCGNVMTNDFCSDPATLTAAVGTFSSATSNVFTADQNAALIAGGFCGTIQNNSWYVFTALATSQTFTITDVSGGGCGDGIQAQVYAVSHTTVGCCTSFTAHSNCYSPGTPGPGVLTASLLTIGQNYMLMVDGWAGDACNYTFSGFTASGILLPIELLYFNASINDENKVLLNWATATEINNDFFGVQRSIDGVTWGLVETIKGAGNSSVKNIYQSIDESPFVGLSYYRLIQVDFDKKITYSKIESIDFSESSESISNVYPNPATNIVNFDWYTNSLKANINIQLICHNGAVLEEKLKLVEKGKNHFQVDLTNYENGIFLLKIENEKNGKNSFLKLVKQ